MSRFLGVIQLSDFARAHFPGLSEKMEKKSIFLIFRLFSGLTDTFEFIVMNDGIHHIVA